MPINPRTPVSTNKDFYEEYNSGSDLILKYTGASGLLTYIDEAELAASGAVIPTDKWGVANGAPYDIYKVYLPASRYTTNTSSIFADLETSPIRTLLRDSILGNFFGKINWAALNLTAPTYWYGKVLRVDFVPLSVGSGFAGVVITFATYVK